MVKTLSISEVRKNLPGLVKFIEEEGGTVIVSVHGKRKVAMFDVELLDEIQDNAEFGITPARVKESMKSKKLNLTELYEYLES